MMGLEVTHSKEKLCFINVYLPYQCPDNYDLYVEYLGKLSAIVDNIIWIVIDNKICDNLVILMPL